METSRTDKRPYRRLGQLPSTPAADPYRILVRADPASKAKAFIWEIVRDDTARLSVKAASTGTYKTMHEAYAAGAAALNDLLST